MDMVMSLLPTPEFTTALPPAEQRIRQVDPYGIIRRWQEPLAQWAYR